MRALLGAPAPAFVVEADRLQAELTSALGSARRMEICAPPGGGATTVGAIFARAQAAAGRRVLWLDGADATPGSLALRLWALVGEGAPPADPLARLAVGPSAAGPPPLLVVEDPPDGVDEAAWGRLPWSQLWLRAEPGRGLRVPPLGPAAVARLGQGLPGGPHLRLEHEGSPGVGVLLAQVQPEDWPQAPTRTGSLALAVSRLRGELWAALHRLAALGQAPADLWPGWVAQGLLQGGLVQARGGDLRVSPSVRAALDLRAWRSREGLDLQALAGRPWQEVRAPFLRLRFAGEAGAGEVLAALRRVEGPLRAERDDAEALFREGERLAARGVPALPAPAPPPPPLAGSDEELLAPPSTAGPLRRLLDRVLAQRHRPPGRPLVEPELRGPAPRRVDWRQRDGLPLPAVLRRVLERGEAVVGWVIRWEVAKVEGSDEAVLTVAYEAGGQTGFTELLVDLQAPPGATRPADQRAWVASLLRQGRPLTVLVSARDPARALVYGGAEPYLFREGEAGLRFAAR